MTIIKKIFSHKTKQFVSLFLIIALFCSLFTMVNASAEEIDDTSISNEVNFVPGVILVGLAPQPEVFLANVNEEDEQTLMFEEFGVVGTETLMELTINNESGGGFVEDSANTVEKIVALYLEDQSPEAVTNTIEELYLIPGVVCAQPNYIIELDESIPNDAYFNNMWNLEKINAPSAWDKFTGSSNVVVGVIDTGIEYTHSDLSDNIWYNPNEIENNGIDDDNNGYIDDVSGWNFVSQTNASGVDTRGHGTHVAGTIGAVGNNANGVVGVNYNVKLVSLKVFESTNGTSTEKIISAINYANNNGIKIVNTSLGGYEGYNGDLLYQAIENYDGLLVASAGNDFTNNDTNPHYPSDYDLPNIICVGATTSADNKHYNYGKNSVHIGAPGVNILSTIPGGGYGYKNGTSMATPHVTGAAALLMGYRPDLTYLEIKDMILASVDEIPALEEMYITGGRLNINNMLNMACGDENYSISTPNLTYNGTDNTVEINKIRLSATGEFPSAAYMEINKYNASNEITSTISDFVNFNNYGIGEYSATTPLVNINLTGDYVEIVVYRGKDKDEKIVSRVIHPITF